MKNIILSQCLILLILSCNNSNYRILDSVIFSWTKDNPRISEEFKIDHHKRTIEIVLQEKSDVGSPIIEDISSANLVYSIVKSDFSVKEIDTIKISFDLPLNVATYGIEKEKVTTSYSYGKDQIETLKKYFDNPTVKRVSNYITMNMSNSDEHELLQSADLANEVFDWYPFENRSGLQILYDYCIYKGLYSKEELLPHRLSLSTIYKIGEEAKINSIQHLDTLYNFIGDIPLDITLFEIDSIGRTFSKSF